MEAALHVPPEPTPIGDKPLYTKRDLEALLGRSERSIEDDARRGVFAWTHKIGKRNALDQAGLQAYLDALRVAPAAKPTKKKARAG
jgi:hypothetical protein